MTTLPKIEYEREEFCRFDDYGRYSKHLSRKLHTLRKSSEKSADVLLFSAERAWSNAMQNKSLNGKLQFTLNKLRKACKHAKELVAILAGRSSSEDLQASIYEDYLRASLSQEKGDYHVSITHYSRALVALQNQSSSLMAAVETGLRYSIYQSGAEERSINLQRFALEHLSTDASNDAWKSLVQKADPIALQEEKGEEMITSVQWAGRSAHLTNPELASAISTAVSAESALQSGCSPNDFDAILAAWTTSSTILQSLLDKEEDQDRSQALELVRAWLSYHSLTDRVARDMALIKTVPVREGVLLCDSINRTYNQILALPGLSATDEETNNTRRREVRGERCVLLAQTYGTSLEAIALMNRALTYFASSSIRRQELVRTLNQTIARYTLSSSKKTRFMPDTWFSGDVKEIGQIPATEQLSRSVTMKPVVFDIAWNYIVAEQTQEHTGGVLGRAAQAIENVLPAAKTERDPAEVNASSGKRGIFGGLFGSAR